MKKLALLLAVICACGSPVVLTYVRRQKGVDGAWDASHGGRESKLDATGSVAVVTFMERTFELRGFDDIVGVVATDKVRLKANKVDVVIDTNEFRAREGDRGVRRALKDIPKGRRLVYANGRVWLE